ncbi:hypothetical protein PMSD_01190 [Paenibacillus macquariensis subsp. defensor]|nr:hypothetical protein PMSD_01190 [Paenibacillus macquariensis subsp. defensor]
MIKNYKKSLIEPLIGEELHIFHTNAEIDQVMNDIISIIRDNVHGCYLLGGFRGTGKTSFVNLCCAKFEKNRILKISMDCNKFIDVSNFLFFFLEELVKAIKTIKLTKELESAITKMHEQVAYKNLERKSQIRINKVLNNNMTENSKNQKVTINFSLMDKILSFANGQEHHNKLRQEYNNAIERSEVFELEARNDEFIMVEKLSRILKRLSEEYQLIMVIDEIDKQDNLFLEDLFGLYKNLFLNSHLITLFVVDQNKYQDIVFSSEMDDKLRVYFTRPFYLPTFNLDDIRSYLYREFQVNSMMKCYVVAYLTNGVMRKINTYNYLEGYRDSLTMLKAILYNDLINTPIISRYTTPYVIDKYKFIVKEFVEVLFYHQKMGTKRIIEFFRERFNKHNIPIDPESISSFLVEITLKNSSFIVNKSSAEIVIIKIGPKSYNFHLDEQDENSKIFFDKTLRQVHDINRSLLKTKANPIRVVERDYQGFDHFIRIIETNYRSVKNIIIVKKLSNWDENEVDNHSAILIMDRPIGYIIYYVEECSFSYEGPPGEENLIDFMKENNIPIIIVETDDELVKENMEFILEQADKMIYKGNL